MVRKEGAAKQKRNFDGEKIRFIRRRKKETTKQKRNFDGEERSSRTKKSMYVAATGIRMDDGSRQRPRQGNGPQDLHLKSKNNEVGVQCANEGQDKGPRDLS